MSPLKTVTIQTRRGLVAVCLLAVFLLPLAAWIGGTRVNDTAELAQEIQRQRVDALLMNCREQNRRHDRTVATLDALLVKRVRTAGKRERVRLRASRASTISLIQALAPKRRCDEYAARLAPTPQAK